MALGYVRLEMRDGAKLSEARDERWHWVTWGWRWEIVPSYLRLEMRDGTGLPEGRTQWSVSHPLTSQVDRVSWVAPDRDPDQQQSSCYPSFSSEMLLLSNTAVSAYGGTVWFKWKPNVFCDEIDMYEYSAVGICTVHTWNSASFNITVVN